MTHPPAPHETFFGPEDLAALAKAFAGAVTIAADERGPYAILPAHRLRRCLACALLDAARQGVRDVALLRAQALRTVAATLEVAPAQPARPTIRPGNARSHRRIAA